MTKTMTAVLVQDPEYKTGDLWPMALFEDYEKAVGAMMITMQNELHSKYPDSDIECSSLVPCGAHDDDFDGVKLTMTARSKETYKQLAERTGYVFDMEVQE